jgi:transcriptional regulator with XRE-family HTH domain
MHTLQEVVSALGISEKKLCDEFGYSAKDVQKLLSGEKAPSKIELSAFCNLSGVSVDFMNGGKATKDAERRVEEYSRGQGILRQIADKKDEIRRDISNAGYDIMDSEIDKYFDFSPIQYGRGDEALVTRAAITDDNARLLIAMEKAFSDFRFNCSFVNGEPSSSSSYMNNDLWSTIKGDLLRIVRKCHLHDSGFADLMRPSDEVLMLFVNGTFAWDDKKVLTLINKGAFCLSQLGSIWVGGESSEEIKPQKDVAKTLMLKAYLEERVGPNDR